MASKMTKDTFYGSGKVYSVAYTDGMINKTDILEKLETIMVEDNQIGFLKNGFTFTIETETLSDQSDLGEMKIDTITKEKGKCDFALFNASLDVIAEQYPSIANAVVESAKSLHKQLYGGLGSSSAATIRELIDDDPSINEAGDGENLNDPSDMENEPND